MKIRRGSLMLEALIAVGISGFFVTALIGYILIANNGTTRAKENALALWATQEGIDALRSMHFSDLANTTTGAITFTNNRWTLSTNGPQTLPNGSTRVVKVENILRDYQCRIAASGGTIDLDSKKLTSTTTWVDAAGRSHSETLSTLRTRWNSPQGSCFAAAQSAQVTFDISGAIFSGGKQLRNVFFTNTGSSNVTVDTIQFTWTNGAEFDQLFMDTSKVWSSTGPGTPSGSVTSGTTIDIENFVLAAGETAEINKGQFNMQMNGVTITMTVTFTDGSAWTSPAFTPS